MVEPVSNRLLHFARRLQKAASFSDLLAVAQEEVKTALGYDHVWLLLAEREGADELKLIEVAGEQREVMWQVAPTLEVKGDRFLEAMMKADEPIVIYDARSDPRTNQSIAEKLGDRTLVNVPLRLLDKPFGFFGLGSFNSENCRTLSDADVAYLVGMASQLSVAASRIRFLEERAAAGKERQELERRILQMQKLESLGLLAGGVAHDFNNLLTVIMASAAQVEKVFAATPSHVEIQAIHAASKRAGDLTRQLLAMSREQALSLRPLNMNLQLRLLIELARRVLPESISIELCGVRALPLVEGDASQIDQVFMNLFVNARDAMPDGGRLSVQTEEVLLNGRYTEAHPWAKAGRYVLITVTDTGTGMSREVQERIFEPFFTTKGQRAGTGLGLAVAYGVVRQHGGMLHCYSEPGLGSSFKVYLPVLERPAEAVGNKLRRAPRAGSERLLVAEDDEQVRAVVVRILERAGYRVTAVGDGEAACRALARDEYSLLLLDVVMPGLQCAEIIERVQALRPATKILLSSGYTAGANVDALTRKTGFELLRKPFDPDQVLAAIREALDAPAPRLFTN